MTQQSLEPEFGERTPAKELMVGVTLLTKDGRITGNAIITEVRPHLVFHKLYVTETDFGNVMTLIESEINSMFNLGFVNTVDKWKVDRENARTQNNSDPAKELSTPHHD